MIAPLALALSAVALLVGPGVAVAAPPPPAGLQVQGGEEAWHADRVFRLNWQAPLGIVASHYRVRDPSGSVVAERRLYWETTGAEIEVPDVPASYLVEVWLEDSAGGEGPAAEARLRFDDGRPAAVEPHTTGAWIGRDAFPLALRLAHVAAAPLSGIRGYAVAIDPVPGREPCAASDRCSEAETDLSGGAADDTLWIADLPEGTSYASAVAVSGSGMRSVETGRTTLRVDETPPAVRLSGVPAGWVNHAVTLTASAADGGSGMEAEAGAPAPFTAIRIDGGAPAIAAGDEVSASAIDQGVHSVAYYARDLAGNVADGGVDNGVRNPAPASAEVRIDRTPPGVAFVNAQDPRDPELIRARIADALSGADAARGWIGVRRDGSGDPFTRLPAVAGPDDELRARWDSDAYPPGTYEFAATAYDRAGNAASGERRADGERMTLTNPLKTAASLLAGFAAGPGLAPSPASRSAPYGRGVLLSGRLTAGPGAPLAGQPVRVVERLAGGSPAEGATIARTAADGTFAVRLPPGPSREAFAVFDGSPTLTRAVSQPLRLAVRSGVRLRTSSGEARVGGAPLVFRGAVAGAERTAPAEGVAVQLQFRLGRGRWSEFRSVRTDRHGRFRYAYRFSDDDSRGVRFQFRAYVPAQDGWPYEPGGSRPVIVEGV